MIYAELETVGIGGGPGIVVSIRAGAGAPALLDHRGAPIFATFTDALTVLGQAWWV
jgi:hypothetical protein